MHIIRVFKVRELNSKNKPSIRCGKNEDLSGMLIGSSDIRAFVSTFAAYLGNFSVPVCISFEPPVAGYVEVGKPPVRLLPLSKAEQENFWKHLSKLLSISTVTSIRKKVA